MRRVLTALALAVVLPLPVLADITVKPGETLSEIAERHGVSVNQLMRANGIKDPTLVQAGQRLVIPGRGPSGGQTGGGGGNGASVLVNPGDTLSEIAERNGISLQRLMQLNGITNPAMVEAGRRLVITGGSGSGGSRPSSGAGSNYTVKSGETLGEIAERYNTSVNRLMQLNGISDPTQLQAGSRLVVPGARQPSGTSSTRTGSTNSGSREHVVKEGETLSEIAEAYNLPMQKLASLNSISDPDLLMSGTRLKLTAPPPVRAPRPTIKPAQAAAPTKPKPKPAAVAKRPQTSGGNSTAPAAPVIASTTAPASRKPTTTSTASSAAPAAPVSSSTTAAATRKPTTTTAVASTAATTTPAATKAPATDNKPASSSSPTTATRKPTTTTTAVAATAATTTPAATKAPAANTKPVVVATATAKKPETPDWRTYGPLQVDWAKWQSMGGSYVAPSLNASGQLLYTAINCGARKLNATSPTGQWKTWESPSTDAEQQLVSDLCKAKGS
jgi:LysM repeat protein